ncbi:DUF6941 family protein [Streptomyces xinghaiensis]|uniref:DUF6941 family protein n=1 Tax=Streptomyces xinghaiensis TaxID=1038928 RepID=UPI000593C56B|nr:hypothetical protein [Streptomyces xinghaiensis]MZE80853.1 hypothetical protein [Streptomyces sp. SID5475]
MDVTLALARAANIDVSGHINALGLGWEVIGPSPLPAFVIIAVARVAPEDSERPLETELKLVDSEGQLVTLSNDSDRELVIQNQIKVPPAFERPPGLHGGAAMIVDMSPGLVLDPGLYEWVLSLNGETYPQWRRRFYVRAKSDEFPNRLHLSSSADS